MVASPPPGENQTRLAKVCASERVEGLTVRPRTLCWHLQVADPEGSSVDFGLSAEVKTEQPIYFLLPRLAGRRLGALLCKYVLLEDSLRKNLRNMPVLDPVFYG